MEVHPTLVSHNLRGLEEKAAMLQIQHLSPQSILHNIHQSQFICKLLQDRKQHYYFKCKAIFIVSCRHIS